MATKTIGVCTSAEKSNIEGLLKFLRTLPGSETKFVELPYNDLDSYWPDPMTFDGLILCHSINNRRFAITDVLDALYNEFLPRANNVCGKIQTYVIVHDFSWPLCHGIEKEGQPGDHAQIKEAHMESFRIRQPTTFKCSVDAMICGKLNKDEIEMDDEDKQRVEDFVANTVKQPLSSRLQYLGLYLFALAIAMLMIPFPGVFDLVSTALGCYVCIPKGHHLVRKWKESSWSEVVSGLIDFVSTEVSHLIKLLRSHTSVGQIMNPAKSCAVSILQLPGRIVVSTMNSASTITSTFKHYWEIVREKKWKNVINQVISIEYKENVITMTNIVWTSFLQFVPSCVQKLGTEVRDEILLKAYYEPPRLQGGLFRFACWWCMIWLMLSWCTVRFTGKKVLGV